jgi:septum formation protein
MINNIKFPIILGSSSPQRLSLLKKINIEPTLTVSPNVDESVLKKEKPLEYVKRIAKAKALAVQHLHPNTFIISADTSVIVGANILGKPRDAIEALNFLDMLSGRSHRVITAYCVISNEGRVVVKYDTTRVKIKSLSVLEKEFYLQSNEWQNKSGGYAIQGIFEIFVEQIVGSVSNVIGLPINKLYNTLNSLGYSVLNVK